MIYKTHKHRPRSVEQHYRALYLCVLRQKQFYETEMLTVLMVGEL